MTRSALIPLVALLAAAPGTAHATEDPATTFVNKAGEVGAHTCRDHGGSEETCNSVPAGKHPSAEAIEAYSRSDVHRALTFQFQLGATVPFANAPWVGTHNSFNSLAYGYTPSRSDSNQQLTVAQQLEIDVRSVELDVHWVNGEPKACHGTEQHAGCSTEGPLGVHLDEIAAFLNRPERKDQVVLLYLEDQIGDPTGYDTVSAELDRAFGPKLYRNPGGKCSPKLPLTLTRKRVLAAGAQVVAVASGCGGGEANAATAWSQRVFDWSGDVHSESRPRDYGDFPHCGRHDFDRAKYQDRIIRYFEDSTFVTSSASTAGAAEPDDGITPQTAAAMTRCGVDLFGFDQLLPDDGRLESLVWTWARGEPRMGARCAVQRRPDARWEASACTGRRPAACVRRDGRWLVTKRPVTRRSAARACKRLGARFALPRTGYENHLLRTAAQTPSKPRSTWLALRLKRAGWRPTPR